MENGNIYVSENGNRFFLVDRSVEPINVYLYDSEKKRRSKLFESDSLESIKFDSDAKYLFFDMIDGNTKYINIEDENASLRVLSFGISTDKFDWNNRGNIYFFVNSLEQFETDKFPDLAAAIKEYDGDLSSVVFLTEYDLVNDEEVRYHTYFENIGFDELEVDKEYGGNEIYVDTENKSYTLVD